MSKHLSLVLLLVALIGLIAFVRVYWGGEQGVMFVWKTEPSFTDSFVYVPEVTALAKEDLDNDHPGVWEQLVAMDLINEEHEAKLSQIRQKRMRRLSQLKADKANKVANNDKKAAPVKAAKPVKAEAITKQN